MKCIMDMRYAVPPLINLFFFMLPDSQQPKQPWNQDGGSETQTDHHHISRLLLLAIAIILFLFTSLKLPLTASAAATDPIRIRTGDFSGAVAISLVASFIFPPHLFWVAFILIICCSAWHAFIFNLFYKHFLCCLQAIPSISISIGITHPHGSSEVPEPDALLETDMRIDINEGQPMQVELSNLDHESVVIDIDGGLEA